MFSWFRVVTFTVVVMALVLGSFGFASPVAAASPEKQDQPCNIGEASDGFTPTSITLSVKKTEKGLELTVGSSPFFGEFYQPMMRVKARYWSGKFPFYYKVLVGGDFNDAAVGSILLADTNVSVDKIEEIFAVYRGRRYEPSVNLAFPKDTTTITLNRTCVSVTKL